jgi:hypothetical protein
MNLDIKSMKMVLNKFTRKNYLIVIDEYIYNELYFNLLKKFNFDHRINDISTMVEYVETKIEKK